MEITLNRQTRKFELQATRAEVEIIQNALCITMSGRHIPSELKEERRITANMGVEIDKALAKK